jgi:hypothetical protein
MPSFWFSGERLQICLKLYRGAEEKKETGLTTRKKSDK